MSLQVRPGGNLCLSIHIIAIIAMRCQYRYKSGRLGYIAEYQDGGSGTSFGFLSVCEKIYKSGSQSLSPSLTKIWFKMSSMYSHVDRA